MPHLEKVFCSAAHLSHWLACHNFPLQGSMEYLKHFLNSLTHSHTHIHTQQNAFLTLFPSCRCTSLALYASQPSHKELRVYPLYECNIIHQTDLCQGNS